MKKFKLLSLKSLVPQSKVTKPRKPATRLAARLTQPAYDDYEEEPTTKLSTAFVVVLVLHLVAVGGIYAFHSIKAKRREADGTAITASVAAGKDTGGKADAAAKPQPVPAPPAHSLAAVPTPPPPSAVAPPTKAVAAVPMEKVPTGPSAVVPHAVKAQSTAGAATTGAGATHAPNATAKAPGGSAAHGTAGEPSSKTYTVQKGDNPVVIAKRMGVNYDELLKLNGVDDPKRLKIGQVLKLPVRTKSNGN
jgi:LysM repeat protein